MVKKKKRTQKSFDLGDWKPVKDLKTYKKKLIKAAKNTLKKDLRKYCDNKMC